MTSEEVYRKLPEYLEGGLWPAERAEIEKICNENEELRRALQVSSLIDASLTQQTWLEPSPDFTKSVISRVQEYQCVESVPLWVRIWDRSRVWISVATLLIVMAFSWDVVSGWGLRVLSDAGVWLRDVTGFAIFTVHPIIILGLIIPLIAGGVTTYVLTSRSRFH
ncbi:hypothetical protein EHM69_01565 [candidate division KSB1 bacterium]|nr:MAG: hypothetical protein EHM69_01565 [candidate division KSB1 bacterium]